MPANSSSRSHLRRAREKLLLFVLPVNIAQERRDLPQQRHCYRPVSQEGPRFAAGQNLPLDQQLAVFHRRRPPGPAAPGKAASLGASKMAATRARSVSERTMSAEARPPRTSPSASTTMDLPLPVSPVSRFSPAWKLHADAFHHGVILHHQFQQHSMKLYEVLLRLNPGAVTAAELRHTVKQNRIILFFTEFNRACSARYQVSLWHAVSRKEPG